MELLDKIKTFLDGGKDKQNNGYGNGNGNGNGDGYGYGNGNGYGDGNGDEDGSGYGNGGRDEYGNGYGDQNGYGNGYGYRNGYGNGYGEGSGSGSGDGSGSGNIKTISGHPIISINDIQTLVYDIKDNILKGATFNNNLSLKDCYVVTEKGYFAHGESIKSANIALQAKILIDNPIIEKLNIYEKG